VGGENRIGVWDMGERKVGDGKVNLIPRNSKPEPMPVSNKARDERFIFIGG
jgi:hypothetical protein